MKTNLATKTLLTHTWALTGAGDMHSCYRATLAQLVRETEARIRAVLPTASAFEWNLMVPAHEWVVVALDQHRAVVGEYALTRHTH